MKSLFFFLLFFAGATCTLELHAQEDQDMPVEDATVETVTIAQAIQANSETTTLAAALEAAGLVDVLNAGQGLILMAPTDAAFAALPDGVLDALLLPENAEALSTLLQYHVVDNADAESTTAMTDLLDSEEVTVGDRMDTDNGAIYLIDQVLIPADFDVDALMGQN